MRKSVEQWKFVQVCFFFTVLVVDNLVVFDQVSEFLHEHAAKVHQGFSAVDVGAEAFETS
ncbi:hypothetical protein BpHYR1_017589 [Brachionus plicatilis]|uniref:Uncharacterized protein n=1 Tax=Brachionus plicatilis TaxID=10195 RepID=A0A3M7SD46_BRAPC|nr:hypothetical protein BpHYR1_017589 [Brachionus plicatilis]